MRMVQNCMQQSLLQLHRNTSECHAINAKPFDISYLPIDKISLQCYWCNNFNSRQNSIMSKKSTFTLAEASKLYGFATSTLHRDSKGTRKDGKTLSTKKELRKGKEITVVELTELIRFYGEPAKQEDETPPITQTANAELAIEVAELKAKLAGEEALRRQIETERDRAIEQVDAWQKQAENSQKLLTDERERAEQKKHWWQFNK